MLRRTFKTKEVAIAARLDAEMKFGVVVERNKGCDMNDKNDSVLYPFEAEWAERQAEPMPDIGIDWSVPSPLAFDQMPERNTETLTLFDERRKND